MVSNNKIRRYLYTNILVYSIDLSKENRQKHRAALEILRSSEIEILCLSSQVITEFMNNYFKLMLYLYYYFGILQ